MLLPLACLAIVAQSPTTKPTLQEYAVDAGESIVEFSVGFALSRVKGRFPDTHGTILYDPDHPERSSVAVVIETRTIDTGWPHRDEHLRTDDFFDSEARVTPAARCATGDLMSGASRAAPTLTREKRVASLPPNAVRWPTGEKPHSLARRDAARAVPGRPRPSPAEHQRSVRRRTSMASGTDARRRVRLPGNAISHTSAHARS
jgi:hypothetical protein